MRKHGKGSEPKGGAQQFPAMALILGGECAAKWHSLQRVAERAGGMPVVRCPGQVREILAVCRRLRPAILVISERDYQDVWQACRSEDTNSLLGIRILLASAHCADDYGQLERLLRSGCWGTISPEADSKTLWKAAQVIAQGQFWVSRTALTQISLRYMLADSLGLTSREAEILQLVAQGCSNQEIAERLFISVETVRWHLRGIYNKLGVHDRLSAVIHVHGSSAGFVEAAPPSSNLENSVPH